MGGIYFRLVHIRLGMTVLRELMSMSQTLGNLAAHKKAVSVRRRMPSLVLAAVVLVLAGRLAYVHAQSPPAGLPKSQPAAATSPAGKGSPEAAIPASPWTGPVPDGARAVREGWFLDPQPQRLRLALPETIERCFVIPIHDAISGTTADSVKRKVRRCLDSRAQLVIFDLDTPGGESGAMSAIVDQIQESLADVPTIAFVHSKAFSAGAVISVACREIIMTSTAVFGDAMPIMISGGQLVAIPREERGKFESAARALIRTSAQLNGYNIAMCEAMITLDMEVWLIRNVETGELRIVDAQDWAGRVKGAPSTATRPAEEGSRWEFIQIVDGPNELVTLTANEAQRYGFVHRTADSSGALYRMLGVTGRPEVLEDVWSETLVEFLTSPVVAGILLFLAVICIYIELHTPGFGAPGILGIVFFAILFGSRYLTGLANWWEIGLFAVGLILLLVEVFVTPGLGIAGIAGAICCIVGLLAMMIPNLPGELPVPRSPIDWVRFGDNVFWMLAGLVGSGVFAAVLSRFLPRAPLTRLLFPEPVVTGPDAAVPDDSLLRRVQVGDVGVVEGMCRPVGKVRFGEEILDAVSQGECIEAGTAVRVLRREGSRVVVEAVQ